MGRCHKPISKGSRPWASDTRSDAIDEILKLRYEYVVIRERLFHVTAAAAARIKKVDGQLMDCATTGRVFGARIGPRNWNNVFAMPGHPYLAYNLTLLHDLVTILDEWVRSQTASSGSLSRMYRRREIECEAHLSP